jgi:hypothetical protein
MKIHQIKNIFPDVRVARYNLTAWQKINSDSIYFIGREVTKPGAKGEPDTGILKLFEINEQGAVVQERLIWRPMYDGINLEILVLWSLTMKILLLINCCFTTKGN